MAEMSSEDYATSLMQNKHKYIDGDTWRCFTATVETTHNKTDIRKDWSSSSAYRSCCLNLSVFLSGQCQIADLVQIGGSEIAFWFYRVGLYRTQLQEMECLKCEELLITYP